MAISDGINLLAVKKANRGLILYHVYRNGQMSRKAMTEALGLTPAAITIITNDLLEEDLLVETSSVASNKRGRREIMLRLNDEKYAVAGVHIGAKRVRIMFVDFANNTLCEEEHETSSFNRRSEAILDFIAETLESRLGGKELAGRSLLGVGVSVTGVVDSTAGVSVNSYRIWEPNTQVSAPLSERLGVPVLLTNNICALAHGESFLSKENRKSNMLFIKYGPGVGAVHLTQNEFPSVFNYAAIELGHTIVDASGAPCVCGNNGCLETTVSYDAIEHSIVDLIRPQSSPYLFKAVGSREPDLNMKEVLAAYDAGDRLVERVMDRTAFYLSFAVFNAMRLFDPQIVVLYGEPFENAKFSGALRKCLSAYTQEEKVVISRYNLRLETFGPASAMISYFFEMGGKW